MSLLPSRSNPDRTFCISAYASMYWSVDVVSSGASGRIASCAAGEQALILLFFEIDERKLNLNGSGPQLKNALVPIDVILDRSILLKQTQSQRLLSSQVVEAVAEKQRQEKGPEEDKVSKTFFSTKRITTHYLISTQLLIICFYSPLTCTPCKWAFFYHY